MGMRAPRFWNHPEPGFQADFLRPLGMIYAFFTRRRLRQPGWRAPVPVISVGNFTAGGTGKTPVVRALAEALEARGERVFILSRGYGGRLSGASRVSPEIHSAVDVGDEPLMLARDFPVIVSKDRAAGARLALEQGAELILLDDALQNPALEKDVSLALVDGAVGLGNGLVIPAGPMRGTLKTLLPHVDIVLFMGADARNLAAKLPEHLPRYTAQLEPAASSRIALAGRDVIAFCGIGRPEKFYETLESLGANVIRHVSFADHHSFSDHDVAHLLALREEFKTDLVTTEKDYIRLSGSEALDILRLASLPVPVRVQLPAALLAQVYEAVDSARRRIITASGPA